MKIIIGAVALAIAMPAIAQTAPAHPQHQDHSQHQQQGAAVNSPQAQHPGHQMPGDTTHKGHHDQHKGHVMESGCCADKDGNGKMDCCEGMSARKGDDCCGDDPASKPKASEQSAQPQAHQNH